MLFEFRSLFEVLITSFNKFSKPLLEYEIFSSGCESFLSRYRNMRLLFRMREPFKPLPEYEVFSSGCESLFKPLFTEYEFFFRMQA